MLKLSLKRLTVSKNGKNAALFSLMFVYLCFTNQYNPESKLTDILAETDKSKIDWVYFVQYADQHGNFIKFVESRVNQNQW